MIATVIRFCCVTTAHLVTTAHVKLRFAPEPPNMHRSFLPTRYRDSNRPRLRAWPCIVYALLAMLSLAAGLSVILLLNNLTENLDVFPDKFRFVAALSCILPAAVVYVVTFRILRRITVGLNLISRSDAAHLAPLLLSWPDAWRGSPPDAVSGHRDAG